MGMSSGMCNANMSYNCHDTAIYGGASILYKNPYAEHKVNGFSTPEA